MVNLNCETIGVDWNLKPKNVRYVFDDKMTLQGNLDPCALYADMDSLEASTKKMIDEFGTQKYIANLGHGVYPDTDPEKVKHFIKTVKEYSLEKNAVLNQ